jgi:DNA polymerase-3 subunit beta
MKAVVLKPNLKEGVGIVERATGENLNLPILRNILIEASENKISLTATNLEIAITCLVAGKVIEPGKVSVSANILSSLIGTIPTERLNLEKKGNNLEIKTDNYEGILTGLSSDDFPIIPKVKNMEEWIEIESGYLKDALLQIVSAAQTSDIRPELGSVLMEFLVDKIKFVATDSFRLAEKTIPSQQFKTNYEKEFRILIPIRTIQEVLRILKDSQKIKIYHDDNQVLFKGDNFDLISRLIEGNFPDYQAIIPKEFKTEIVADKQEFINAIRTSGALGNKNNEIKIKISPTKKSIEVFSADQISGESNYILPAKIEGNGANETVFNWKYLMDGLKAIKTDEVYIGINEDRPALMKDPKEGSYYYILAPILTT